MSEKVKLPREVAEAIERFRNIGCDNASIIYTFASGEDKNNIDFANYAADNFDTLLQALVNGYEVEQTPEEIIKHLYDNMFSPNQDAYRNGMIDTLNALNIKIKGVND
ncbi:DUF1642 domain-containing protein [Paenibacillus naphthalenovorans]|uniref:DUF1642 domain-containing protein n=1 Tax=Paenibacillus naphthalenovorans TaxID=162209 RepID=UPI0008921743|nr:DUF1642 domain-containing protein [Paenibacillus naphthalenovorans]SDJ62120.1 Protein of unknown function [Paenibacillus naphthalenovorans]